MRNSRSHCFIDMAVREVIKFVKICCLLQWETVKYVFKIIHIENVIFKIAIKLEITDKKSVFLDILADFSELHANL